MINNPVVTRQASSQVFELSQPTRVAMYVCKVVAEALMSVFRIFGTETLNPIFYKLGLLASKLWVFLFSCYCTLNPIFYKS